MQMMITLRVETKVHKNNAEAMSRLVSDDIRVRLYVPLYNALICPSFDTGLQCDVMWMALILTVSISVKSMMTMMRMISVCHYVIDVSHM